MDKQYDYNQNEKRTYKQWEESGAFSPPAGKDAGKNKTFTIIMPPPNANDPLHMGHAMFVAIEDILIRYHRMKGEDTLWLPGTDHAGIETQFVFEKKLAKEGKSRFDFDRKTLYGMIDEYVKENSGVAIEQMKGLGASADWSRYKFTLNPEIVEGVIKTFIKLNNDGLVYKGERLVNYCTKCGTAYSELEVDHEEKEGKLYYVRYPLAKDKSKFIVVATTRPETMFGDTAVAVHPEDKRYENLVGKMVRLPLCEKDIPVIADKMVEMEFGTGAVKITPAHDQNDFETGERHNLERVQVIGLNGKLMSEAGEFEGLSVIKGREETLKKLEEMDLIEKVEEIKHNVGECYRCHRAIEPLPMSQFFIKTKPLAKKVLEALDNKETLVWGAGREKILRHWLENIKDWNISRQIVWGIRMPVWYEVKDNEGKISVSFVDKKGEFHKGVLRQIIDEGFDLDEVKAGLQQIIVPEYKEKSSQVKYVVSETEPKEGRWIQETDTFDTWFSSGQWPVLTLKTGKPGDFDHYYPTNVMETGYDILPFWVMRMMMLGIYLTGKSPFEKVYLHGLIRSSKGEKMSKSKGNAINPVEMIEKYGSGAVRMALVMSSTPGQDKNVGEDQVRGMRNFANKIWNAARFIEMQKEEKKKGGDEKEEKVFKEKLEEVEKTITRQMDELRIGLAAETVYNEFWHWFCDECIEKGKEGKISIELIYEGLIVFLKLLHPFMPFVTERVWQELGQEGLLIKQAWVDEKK